MTLADLWLVLDNMVGRRMAAVQLLAMGALFEQQLRALHARIGEIPGVRDTSRPFADELAEVDSDHDLYGRASDLLLQFYETLAPKLSGDLNATVARARKAVIGSSGELAVGYIDQAQNAKRRRPGLADAEEVLSLLPVAELGSLKEVAERYIAKGEEIDTLLDARGDAEAVREQESGPLRFKALSLLARLSDAIQLQLEMEEEAELDSPKLPGNLNARIFGYANALVQLRQSGDEISIPDADVDLPDPVNPSTPTPVEA